MSTSTDGQICFGIKFDEDTEFPWLEYDDDIDTWWRDGVCGYKRSREIYTASGEYIGEKPTDDIINAYYEEESSFEKAHPIPVTLVNYCSGSYPMWILAIDVPGFITTANRGYPKVIDPSELSATADQSQLLIKFCEEHDIDTAGEKPEWWLSSYTDS